MGETRLHTKMGHCELAAPIARDEAASEKIPNVGHNEEEEGREGDIGNEIQGGVSQRSNASSGHLLIVNQPTLWVDR